MDYELKIRRLEEETRHEKAMRELQGERLDLHDQSFDHTIAAFAAVGVQLEKIAEIQNRTEKNIEAISVSQALTQKMLQDLIELLTKPGGNGKH
jgi:hypothetical protein